MCWHFKIWAVAWAFQQFGMCDQQRLRPACAYALTDQSLCWSLKYSMTVKLLTEPIWGLLTFCLLLLPLWESVIVLCFVVRYFMSILVLQSSWWGRESWLLCLICLPGDSWWLSGSSSRCHGVVRSLWLWYFLIILTYYSKLKRRLHRLVWTDTCQTTTLLDITCHSSFMSRINFVLSWVEHEKVL